MEDDYSDEDSGGSEEKISGCQECEMYQGRIYELNALLRNNLSERGYEETKRRLDDLVQLQLRHQRQHQ